MSRNKSGAASRPALYNPTAACVLALLFTPIFGALLQARNWDALGEHYGARASRMWVRTTLWLLFVFVIMQAVFQNEPFMQFGGLYFLVVTWASWMVTTGWKQIGYVRELFCSDYPRERLGRVTIFAGGCWVIYSMVSILIAMAIQLTGLDAPRRRERRKPGRRPARARRVRQGWWSRSPSRRGRPNKVLLTSACPSVPIRAFRFPPLKRPRTTCSTCSAAS